MTRAEASRIAAAKARASRTEAAIERCERYGELRRGGYSPQECAWELRISLRHAYRYEAQQRRQAQQRVAA
jgi:hypothetical protein